MKPFNRKNHILFQILHKTRVSNPKKNRVLDDDFGFFGFSDVDKPEKSEIQTRIQTRKSEKSKRFAPLHKT